MAGEVSVLGSVSFGWLYEQGGLVYDEAFFMDPRRRLAQEERANALVAEHFCDDPVYNFEAGLVQVEGRRRPVALVGGIQPNLILGAAVGAKLVFYDDKDPDITQTPLADIQDLSPLWQINWEKTWPIDVLLAQIEQAREALGDTHAIVPPLFWDTTGRATIHGIITTAQKLMGQRIFLEMVDNPAFAREFFDWIAEAYMRLIRLFAGAAGLQITGLHVGECSACMIGPEQFGDFVLPALNELARQFGPLRLHSCGMSDHLLDAFGEVENVNCLNVGSNTSVSSIREGFGEVRIDVLPDSQLLTFTGPADVDAWVRRTFEENGQGRLEFQFHLDAGQPEANSIQICRTLRDLGFRCPRQEVF